MKPDPVGASHDILGAYRRAPPPRRGLHDASSHRARLADLCPMALTSPGKPESCATRRALCHARIHGMIDGLLRDRGDAGRRAPGPVAMRPEVAYGSIASRRGRSRPIRLPARLGGGIPRPSPEARRGDLERRPGRDSSAERGWARILGERVTTSSLRPKDALESGTPSLVMPGKAACRHAFVASDAGPRRSRSSARGVYRGPPPGDVRGARSPRAGGTWPRSSGLERTLRPPYSSASRRGGDAPGLGMPNRGSWYDDSRASPVLQSPGLDSPRPSSIAHRVPDRSRPSSERTSRISGKERW
jgi:hypothetical protein